MRFAILKYAKDREEINMPKIIRHLPKPAVDFYIKHKNPYTEEEINVMEAKGLNVTLPVLKAEKESDSLKVSQSVFKTVHGLLEKDVGIFAPEYGMEIEGGIPSARGKTAFALFSADAAVKVLKKRRKKLSEAEFLIIDGGNYISRLILESLYPNVNFLSLLTPCPDSFVFEKERIYNDTGLVTQVFSSYKNSALKTADVIINGGFLTENIEGILKRGAVYLDINQNKAKLKRFIDKRSDIFLADGIDLVTEAGTFPGAVFESAKFISDENFKDIFSGKGKSTEVQSFIKKIKKEKIKVGTFYCMGIKLKNPGNIGFTA